MDTISTIRDNKEVLVNLDYDKTIYNIEQVKMDNKYVFVSLLGVKLCWNRGNSRSLSAG